MKLFILAASMPALTVAAMYYGLSLDHLDSIVNHGNAWVAK